MQSKMICKLGQKYSKLERKFDSHTSRFVRDENKLQETMSTGLLLSVACIAKLTMSK